MQTPLTSFQEKHRLVLRASLEAADDGLPHIAISDFDMNPVQSSRVGQTLYRLGFVERHHAHMWWVSITDAGRHYLALLDLGIINDTATWIAQPHTALWALETADPGLSEKPHSLTVKAAPFVVNYLLHGSIGCPDEVTLRELEQRYPAVRMWSRVGDAITPALIQAGIDLTDASARQPFLMPPALIDALARATAQTGMNEQDIKRAALAAFLAQLGVLNG